MRLCEPCRTGATLVPDPACPRCGRPVPTSVADRPCPRCAAHPPPFGRLRCVFLYGGTARDLILRYKHGRRVALARPLGSLLAAVALREGLLDGCDLVVPVPAWPARAVKRRHSPPARLALEVAKRCGLPLDTRALERIHAPAADGHAGPRQRRDRVRGAFAVRRPGAVWGRSILLVDDVVTTGATVSEVTEVLLAAGAVRVDVLAVAMATCEAV